MILTNPQTMKDKWLVDELCGSVKSKLIQYGIYNVTEKITFF